MNGQAGTTEVAAMKKIGSNIFTCTQTPNNRIRLSLESTQ